MANTDHTEQRKKWHRDHCDSAHLSLCIHLTGVLTRLQNSQNKSIYWLMHLEYKNTTILVNVLNKLRNLSQRLAQWPLRKLKTSAGVADLALFRKSIQE